MIEGAEYFDSMPKLCVEQTLTCKELYMLDRVAGKAKKIAAADLSSSGSDFVAKDYYSFILKFNARIRTYIGCRADRSFFCSHRFLGAS